MADKFLKAFKLFVLFGIPVLGVVYAYQFTGQDREVIVPFRPFKSPATLIHKAGSLTETLALPLRTPVTALNFWATWCPPCVEEFPAMIELQRQLKDKGVEIVFVSVDDDWGNVEKFLKANQVPFDSAHMYWDPKKEAAQSWGSVKFPETYVVRKDGWVVEKIIGAQQWTRQVVIRYFTELGKKFQDYAFQNDARDALFPFAQMLGLPSAFAAGEPAQAAADAGGPALNEDDRKNLEKLRANIETATQNVQKAEAAEKEEERNLKEQKTILDRRAREQKESESDLDRIQSKMAETRSTLEKTRDSLSNENREKTRVERQVKDIQGRIAGLQRQLEAAKDELTQANKALNTRIHSAETMDKSQASSDEELSSLSGKAENAKTLVGEKRKAAGQASEDIQNRERKLREIRNTVEGARAVLKEQKDKLSEFEKLLKR